MRFSYADFQFGADNQVLQPASASVLFDRKACLIGNKTAPDSEVYLYGSQARGNAHKLSDWDLLILLNKPNVPFEFETKFMDEFYELELETGEVISPLIYSKND